MGFVNSGYDATASSPPGVFQGKRGKTTIVNTYNKVRESFYVTGNEMKGVPI